MNRDSLESARFLCRIPSERRSAVFAVIIHDENRELTGIILFGKSPDGVRDGLSFVASGHDNDDTRPVCKRRRLDIVFAQLPEIAAREKEINPDGQRNRCEQSRRKGHALFCNMPGGKRYARSSGRTGSRLIGLPVAAKIPFHTPGALGRVPGSPPHPAGSLPTLIHPPPPAFPS